MIRTKAQELLELLRKGKGCSSIFGNSYYDDEMQQIIEIAANECKSKVRKNDGTTKRYESDIYIEDIREIIEQLLSDKNSIKNSLVGRLTRTQGREIPGIMKEVKIAKNIDEMGRPCIEVEKPFPDNFEQVISGQLNREELLRDVIRPYVAKLCKRDEKLAKKHLFSRIFSPLNRKEIDDSELMIRMEGYLRKNTDLNEQKIQNMSSYFVFNILGNRSIIHDVVKDELEGNSLQVVGQKKIVGYNGMIQNMSNNLLDILNTIPNPNSGLEEIKDIYANTVGQLQALSIEPENTPELIEEQIKDINRNINRHKQEYYSENGYRNVNVGFNGEDVGLLRKEFVPEAMRLYSQQISGLVEQSQDMSEEEYIKQVAKLHFRFIQIHPFPDGNGRTARAISNMLLLEKNIAATFTKENKDEYMKQMTGLRGFADEKYTKGLYMDQSICDKLEEERGYKLEEYIGIKCLKKAELYKNREITEELKNITEERVE